MTVVNCHFCGAELDDRNAYEKVVGWERHRFAGGANQITLRQPQGQFSCDACIRKLKAGVDPARQATLL